MRGSLSMMASRRFCVHLGWKCPAPARYSTSSPPYIRPSFLRSYRLLPQPPWTIRIQAHTCAQRPSRSPMQRAAVFRKYGPPSVVHVESIPRPTPGNKEVLIRIHATTVSAGDWRVRSLVLPWGFGVLAPLIFGISGPRQPVLGTELSGTVEDIGASVTNFNKGDRVFAFPGAAGGAHAEFIVMPASGMIALAPSNLSMEESAAVCFGGTTALHNLRQAKVKQGEKCLVIGASGAVGSAAVQIAKRVYGAVVTGVSSAGNKDLVLNILGADAFVDYATQNPLANHAEYDVIFDTVGNTKVFTLVAALKPHGRLILISADLSQMASIPRLSMTSSAKILAGPYIGKTQDMSELKKMCEAGQFKPFIGHTFERLEDIVAAHEVVDSGHKRGSVVVKVGAS